jgi:hypothetical protein
VIGGVRGGEDAAIAALGDAGARAIASPAMADALKVVATASSEAEADMISRRLLQAGIHAVAQRTIGGPEFGSSGSRYVYVDEADFERAAALLKEDEGPISDEELARLSEEAGREADTR